MRIIYSLVWFGQGTFILLRISYIIRLHDYVTYAFLFGFLYYNSVRSR